MPEEIKNQQQEIKLDAPAEKIAEPVVTEKVETRAKEEQIDSRDNVLQELKTRQADINFLFEPFPDFGDLKAKCLSDLSITVDGARALMLDEFKARGDNGGPITTAKGCNDLIVQVDAREKFNEGVANSILSRHGIVKRDPQNEFNGITLSRVAEQILVFAGQSVRGLNPGEIATRSLGTDDFKLLMADVANKALQDGYEETPRTWDKLAKIGTLNDFRPHLRAQKGMYSTLDTVVEYGEYKAAETSDEGEYIQGLKKGRILMLSREMIVNDDTQAFSDSASALGMAAMTTVEDDYYAVLNANANMADGVPYYDAGHNNLGTAGDLSITTVDELRVLLAKQRDPGDNTFVYTLPQYLLVESSQLGLAQQLMSSTADPSNANANVTNYVANIATPIDSPRLATATEFHLIGQQKGIEVAFLYGNQTPYIEQLPPRNIDVTEWKVRLEYGVKAINFRRQAKNAGA